MAQTRRKDRINTKLEVLQAASHRFLTDGYSQTLMSDIAGDVGITKGNLTFHYPTKEHLLAEFTRYLCEYHEIVMEQEVEEGKTSLLAYLLELTSMVAICEENEVARDVYLALYRHPMSLRITREYDTDKAKRVFAEYCAEWNDDYFRIAESIASGIEYASLQIENEENIPLEFRIGGIIDSVMKLYDVPKHIREENIRKVLKMDYFRIGRRFTEGFTKYVEESNAKALADFAERKK